MVSFANKIISFFESFPRNWKNPPKGRYMPYKEIAALSVGGIGVRFISYSIGNMILSVGNTLIGNTIGINPTALYAIYVLSLLSSFPLTGLRAKMIDNARSMKGKYRPYIITMGIPTVILGCLFIWMPYEQMTLFGKCAVVLAFNIGFQFFYNFYYDSYDSLINVLSPNSIERSDALSVRCVIENLSPSIINIIIPLLAKAITGENTLYDLSIYRIIFPPMLIAGFFISLLVYFKTEEKIVQAKTHYISIRFVDALKSVAKNKYFWIISLAGWVGFLEGSFNSIMQWMYNYQGACDDKQYALITAIAGNASFWPNLIAPFFIRRYGKKAILIFTNLLSIVFILAMLPVIKMTGTPYAIWMLLAITFINTFVTAMGHLMSPSINADIRDYQQYVSGERIDGMFAAVGLIGNVITMATGLVLPIIYERTGLNEDVAVSLGYDPSNVYDVLYNNDYFVKICSVLIIASVIGAALNVIPYFFFDFTESKQKGVVRVLKLRAMLEDYGNNVISDEALEECVGIIKETNAFKDKTKVNLKKAKADLNGISRKEPKAELKKFRDENEQIEIAKFVSEEMSKYTNAQCKAQLENARSLVASGLNGFLDETLFPVEGINSMPCKTKEEKGIRKDYVSLIKDINDSRKTVAKHFQNGIKVYDITILDGLYEEENKIENELLELSKHMKAFKEAGQTDKIAPLREKIEACRKEKTAVKAKIKEETKKYSNYRRAAKPYLDSVKIITQAESYEKLDDIEILYNERIAHK